MIVDVVMFLIKYYWCPINQKYAHNTLITANYGGDFINFLKSKPPYLYL